MRRTDDRDDSQAREHLQFQHDHDRTLTGTIRVLLVEAAVDNATLLFLKPLSTANLAAAAAIRPRRIHLVGESCCVCRNGKNASLAIAI